MNKKDYYAVMGLSKDATEKDIKMAYRRLARKYHPDLNKAPDAEERFKEVGEAYDVLKDPEKRKAYDRYGFNWDQQHASSGEQQRAHEWYHPGGEAHASYGFDPDLFESLFRHHGYGQTPHPRRGQDLQGSLQISLEDAYQGATKEIQIPLGPQGGHQTIRVKIPKGVKSGQQIRLAGKGHPGHAGAPHGDLFITVNFDKHPLFEVIEQDVYLTLPVAPWEVALGATVTVPTLGGPVDLKIPANSQGGQRLRLQKRGLPGPTPGDQFVLLKVMIPQPTTEEGKAFYKTMAETFPFNPRTHLGV